MRSILLCSSNPLLVKGLYGVLRDAGYLVETVEHPAHAVRSVLQRTYDLAIFDSEPFGLQAEEAVRIIRSVAPGMPVVSAAGGDPFDLERIKRTVHRIVV